MGWLDYHLWEFTAGDMVYGIPDPDDASWGHKVHRASTTKLTRIFDGGIKEFGCVYDMGDNWAHRIVVERIEPAEPNKLYPELLGGEGRCSPEDCGSLPGYYDFLDAIAGPDRGNGSKNKKEALTWYGGPYDPDDIDEDQIRITLNRIANTFDRENRNPPIHERRTH
jgi:hypothetical protein